ncbi:hypothetical protein CHELA40_12495 [Chelatococcus asaccharovorans]|nr:hypothetical protein CHELA40_12495 [Chelatococcus asaccharovorans]CAH1682495.1 hypothetical protein CHELA17_63113 [Chelatococcus asaccharovorans]
MKVLSRKSCQCHQSVTARMAISDSQRLGLPRPAISPLPPCRPRLTFKESQSIEIRVQLSEDRVERRPIPVVEGAGSLIGISVDLSGRGVAETKGFVPPQVRLIPASESIGLVCPVFRGADKSPDAFVLQETGDVVVVTHEVDGHLSGSLLPPELGGKGLELFDKSVAGLIAENIDGAVSVGHDARHERGLVEALLLHKQFQRPIAPAARRNLEHAGFRAFGVDDGTDVQRLNEAKSGDRFGQFFDRDAGFHAPDVRLAEHQLVEGDVARGRQGDFLNGGCHVPYSATDAIT